MKTIKQVEIVPIYLELIPENELLQEGNIYISKKYGCAVHLCLCGCKNLTVTPLGTDDWQLSEKDGKISLTPSIGNFQFPCKSHYIITNNKANFV